MKVLICKASIDFSTQKKWLDNQNRSILTKQLIRAKNNFRSSISNDNLEINSLESALSYLISKEAEGAKIRSKAKWIEEGEKPTRFFFASKINEPEEIPSILFSMKVERKNSLILTSN